jgi:hypothetical protein
MQFFIKSQGSRAERNAFFFPSSASRDMITTVDSHYSELARYQLAICFKFKGQKAKARNLFKELVSTNSSIKKRAQLALNKL